MTVLQKNKMARQAGVALLLLGTAIFAYLIHLIVAPGPLIVDMTVGNARIYFEADRSYVTLPNTCINIRWRFENIRELYYEGNGRVGEDGSEFCVKPGKAPELRVFFQDGSTHNFVFNIGIVVWDPDVSLLVFTGILAWYTGFCLCTGRSPFAPYHRLVRWVNSTAQLPETPIRTDPSSAVQIRVRHIALILGLLTLLTVILRSAANGNGLIEGLKLWCGALIVAITPGLLIVLAFKKLRRFTLLEQIGIALAVTFGLVQCLTILSQTLHIALLTMLYLLFACCTTASFFLWWKTDSTETVPLERLEIILGVFLLCLMIIVYIRGGVFQPLSSEDYIHIAVIRRLAAVPAPSLSNIYYVPDVIYTYPFPGTHYFMALVSRAAETDPFFLYVKLIFLWSAAAILFVYQLARVIFDNPQLAVCTGIVAVVFALNGTFAGIEFFYWGQLATTSHASDVAMNVLLPGLLVLTLYFLKSQEIKSSIFFLVFWLLLDVMLTIVHIREIIQLLVYMGSFLVALLLLRRSERKLLLQTLLLVVLSAGIVVLYVMWQSANIQHLNRYEDLFKVMLREITESYSIVDLLLPPSGGLLQFTSSLVVFYYNWFGGILLVSPVILYVFRRHILVFFAAASIFAYSLMINFAGIVVLYVYVTYSEIFFTPVRNVALFLYVFTGALVYMLVAAAATPYRYIKYGLAVLLLLALYGFAAENYAQKQPPGLLILAVLLLNLVVIWRIWRDDRTKSVQLPRLTMKELLQGLAVILIPVSLLTAIPEWSPLNIVEPYYTYEESLTMVECHPKGCMPPAHLIRWMKEHLVSTDMMATNVFNPMLVTAYADAQVPALPSYVALPADVFPLYDQFHTDAMRSHLSQTFFNPAESLDVRLRFIQAFKVTHLLVDPAEYETMKTTLAQWTDIFEVVYDHENWLVYRVHPDD